MEQCKFVVVLNKSYELTDLISGLGHVTAGLVGSLSGDVSQLSFVEYQSKDLKAYPWISDWPFIILKGGGGQLATYRELLVAQELPCVTYTDTMLMGGSAAQQEATRSRASSDLTPLAVATFGPRAKVDALTKKFSLWR